MRLLSLLVWGCAVGAAVGAVHALTQHDGPTAWHLAAGALVLSVAGAGTDLACKVAGR